MALNPDWFPGGQPFDKGEARAMLAQLIAWFGALPDDFTGLVGATLVVDSDLKLKSGTATDGLPINQRKAAIFGFSLKLWPAVLTDTAISAAPEHTGYTVRCSNAAQQTITVPETVPDGWCATYLQEGAGRLLVAGGAITGGGNLAVRNFNAHTKSAGQWAPIAVLRSGANLILMGTTGA